jgi:ATP-dependent helicase/nuclease subunit B
MPVTLYPILPGGRLDEFIAAFRAAAAADPFGSWLILPTGRLMREVLHRLDEEGAAVIQSRVTTLAGFARTLFEDHASDETLIDETAATFILSHILAEHADRLPLLTRKGGTSQGVVRELQMLITVLTVRQVAYPEALGDLQSEKSEEIARVRDAYFHFLEEQHLVDSTTLLLWAKRWLEENEEDLGNVWIYGLIDPLPLEKSFILAIRDQAAILHYALPDLPDQRGEWLGGAERLVALPEEDPLRLRIASLFSSDTAWEAGDRIRVAGWKDRIEEIRGIAGEVRELIDGGARPDEITVAFPDLSGGATLVDEIFPDFGIPYAASEGVPLIRSPLVQALMTVLATPAGSYRREDVVALLTSPYPGGPAGQMDGHVVDALARQERITRGAGAWDRWLSAPATREEDEKTTEMKKDLAILFADLSSLEGTRTISDHVAAYRSLLDRWGCGCLPEDGEPALRAQEGRDLAAFCQILDSLAASSSTVPQRPVSLAGFHSSLASLLAGARTVQPRNHNAVQVVGIRELQHLSIQYLFIGGLLEGEMPRLTTRLPFTNDLETKRLGTRTGADILREERSYFIAALLAGRHIYLSAPCSDGDRPLLQSEFLDTVQDAAGTWGDRKWRCSRLGAAAAAGAAFAKGQFTEGSALLPSHLHAGTIITRINIENYYRVGAFDSPFDAVLSGDQEICSALAGRFGANAVYSPTALETYAHCPFMFYLGKVLGLKPFPDAEVDLTAQERGSLVHQIAFRFYTGWTENSGSRVTKESYSQALEEIRTIAQEELGRFNFSSPAWVVETEHLIGSEATGPGVLEEFLATEERLSATPFVPVHFELSFGMPIADDNVDAASVQAPVAIDLDPAGGERLLLRGRIDRVDITPDGSFLVTDYKTGISHPQPQDIAQGTALQIPLYIRAVAALTGLEGAGGTYYTVRKGKTKDQAVFWDARQKEYFKMFSPARNSEVGAIEEAIQASLDHVRGYLHAIREGRFPPEVAQIPCPAYCGFRTVCRFNEWRLPASRGE